MHISDCLMACMQSPVDKFGYRVPQCLSRWYKPHACPESGKEKINNAYSLSVSWTQQFGGPDQPGFTRVLLSEQKWYCQTNHKGVRGSNILSFVECGVASPKVNIHYHYIANWPEPRRSLGQHSHTHTYTVCVWIHTSLTYKCVYLRNRAIYAL